MSQDANGAQEQHELSPLEKMRAAVKAQRDANRAIAERAEEAKEMARLQEELEYEKARSLAYAQHGHDRVLGGEIEGAGFCILRWPDEITWRHFNNKGILKKDALNQDLCDDLVTRCRVWPEPPKFKEMLEKNPTASTQLATAIIKVMQPDDADLGKGQASSLRLR